MYSYPGGQDGKGRGKGFMRERYAVAAEEDAWYDSYYDDYEYTDDYDGEVVYLRTGPSKGHSRRHSAAASRYAADFVRPPRYRGFGYGKGKATPTSFTPTQDDYWEPQAKGRLAQARPQYRPRAPPRHLYPDDLTYSDDEEGEPAVDHSYRAEYGHAPNPRGPPDRPRPTPQAPLVALEQGSVRELRAYRNEIDNVEPYRDRPFMVDRYGKGRNYSGSRVYADGWADEEPYEIRHSHRESWSHEHYSAGEHPRGPTPYRTLPGEEEGYNAVSHRMAASYHEERQQGHAPRRYEGAVIPAHMLQEQQHVIVSDRAQVNVSPVFMTPRDPATDQDYDDVPCMRKTVSDIGYYPADSSQDAPPQQQQYYAEEDTEGLPSSSVYQSPRVNAQHVDMVVSASPTVIPAPTTPPNPPVATQQVYLLQQQHVFEQQQLQLHQMQQRQKLELELQLQSHENTPYIGLDQPATDVIMQQAQDTGALVVSRGFPEIGAGNSEAKEAEDDTSESLQARVASISLDVLRGYSGTEYDDAWVQLEYVPQEDIDPATGVQRYPEMVAPANYFYNEISGETSWEIPEPVADLIDARLAAAANITNVEAPGESGQIVEDCDDGEDGEKAVRSQFGAASSEESDENLKSHQETVGPSDYHAFATAQEPQGLHQYCVPMEHIPPPPDVPPAASDISSVYLQESIVHPAVPLQQPLHTSPRFGSQHDTRGFLSDSNYIDVCLTQHEEYASGNLSDSNAAAAMHHISASSSMWRGKQRHERLSLGHSVGQVLSSVANGISSMMEDAEANSPGEIARRRKFKQRAMMAQRMRTSSRTNPTSETLLPRTAQDEIGDQSESEFNMPVKPSVQQKTSQSVTKPSMVDKVVNKTAVVLESTASYLLSLGQPVHLENMSSLDLERGKKPTAVSDNDAYVRRAVSSADPKTPTVPQATTEQCLSD